MARNGRVLAGGGVYPDIMFATVVTEVTALVLYVLYTILSQLLFEKFFCL